MKRQPTSVHEHPTISGVDVEPSCPFCAITSVYQPISPLSAPGNSLLDPERVDRPAFVLLSTEHVVAFLDIFPLTRGHVLVAPRKHRVKVGQLSADESAEVSFIWYCGTSGIAIRHITCTRVSCCPTGLQTTIQNSYPSVSITTSNHTKFHQIGRLLPLLARAVTRSVLPDIPHEEVDYNIVQNNGTIFSFFSLFLSHIHLNP